MSRESKSLADELEALHALGRIVGRELGEAVAATRWFRLIVRFADWADRKVPALGWVDRHSPAWLRFPSWAFFEMLGTVYLVVAGGVLVALAIRWLAR